MTSLFVYGTLRQGFANEHILTDIGGVFEGAEVQGHYVNSGWGAEMGCPALQLDKEGDWIKGQIFSSDNLKDHWGFLDKFEGKEYERVKAEVKLINGKTQLVSVYVVASKK